MLTTRRQRRMPGLIPFVPNVMPRSELMDNMMRQLFEEDFRSDSVPQPVSWMPSVDITENKDELIVAAELPGLAEKDVEVEFEDNILTIQGQKSEEKKEGVDNRYHMWERTFGSFRRSFTMPRNIDAAKVEATFKDGVLKVRLPIAEADRVKNRKIPIGAGK